MFKQYFRQIPILAPLIVLLFFMGITGCGKDLADTASVLLTACTPEFIDLKGFDEEKRLITINISEFSQYPIESYTQWVKETYTDENTIVVLFTDDNDCFQDMAEAREYLISNGYEAFIDENFDWTAVRICRKNANQPIKTPETLQLHVSYPAITAAEGFKIKMKYAAKTWNVDEVIPTYMS